MSVGATTWLCEPDEADLPKEVLELWSKPLETLADARARAILDFALKLTLSPAEMAEDPEYETLGR
jgi:hypothetical protein